MSTTVCSSSARSLLMPRNQDLSVYNQPMRKVKRILFGPADPQATQKFIDEELKKIKTTKSEVWNFDFDKGSILHPDGPYDWRPVTPNKQIRLIKRKEDAEIDNSDQYCNLAEIKIVRPQARCLSYGNARNVKIQQSRITDYMRATKRSAPSSESTKKQGKSEWDPEISNKIPRLDIKS